MRKTIRVPTAPGRIYLYGLDRELGGEPREHRHGNGVNASGGLDSMQWTDVLKLDIGSEAEARLQPLAV
jgi:hypothetical protein